jgi:type II secretory pathway component PulF
MARYQYQARDGAGALASGILAAQSAEEAGKLLRNEGKYIVRIDELIESADDGELSLAQHARRVRRQDVIFFAHQMAIMIETGVPICDALESIVEQSGNPSFKAVTRDVATQVQSGLEFSRALSRYPNVFPTVMIGLIRAAEVSGTMGQMLERISDYMTKEMRTTKAIRGALAYPLFMVLMTLGVTIFLMAFVLPRFSAIYTAKGQALPAPTQVLLAVSGALINYWKGWLGGAVALAIGGVWFGRTPTGAKMIDWCKLNLPLVKTLSIQLYVTRSCRTMGMMVNAGVPMLDAVEITGHVTNNYYFGELWRSVDQHLRQGMQLSDPLFASTLIPRSVVQMIRSGEKSGRLGHVLGKIAEFTEEEFDRSVKGATQFIEPLMIVVMGGLIGFVAISLLLPIFNVGKVISG